MAVPEPGKIFGKYRIVRPLGRGGMGVVFLAEDANLGREVALKILDRTVTCGEDFEERFRQEGRTVAGLKHPNIVTIHSLERIDGDWVIDMPYIEGGSLADVSCHGGLTLGQQLGYARDALLALASCHVAGIVHRDVKPNNILIAADGRAMLSDFGLAKLLAVHQTASLRTGASSGFFMGTPKYAPPECWDEQEPTPAWDVYSMGMTLYESIAGETPYDATTPLGLMKQMLERPIPPLKEAAPGISDDLSALVQRMLAQEPADRPNDAEEVLELFWKLPELREQSDASHVVKMPVRRPPPHFHSAPARIRRLPRRVLIGAVVALALVAVMTAGISRRHSLWGGAAKIWQATKDPGPSEVFRAYDTVEPATQEVRRQHWVVRPDGPPFKWTILAWDVTSIWVLTGVPDGETGMRFEGNWAEFTDTTARVFRHGTVSGTGRWVTPNESMAANFTFTGSQDGMQREQSFTLSPSGEHFDQREFIRRFESSDCVQALIYTELAGRDAPWISTIEKSFMVGVTPNVVVPFLGTAQGIITLDGRLNEPAWASPMASDPVEFGCLPDSASSGLAQMYLRYSKEGLYVGLRVERAVANPCLLVGILNRFSVPLARSPRWLVQADGQSITASQTLRDGRPSAWDCQWQVMQTTVGNHWESEIFVPFATLGTSFSVEPGDRLRLNCELSETKVREVTRVTSWGADDSTEVEHGVVLVIGKITAGGAPQ